MATRADITASHQWFTNETKRFDFSITSDEPIDGFALSWTIKRRPADSDAAALIVKTTAGGGIIHTSPAQKMCTVTVMETDTALMAPGMYHHELARVDVGSRTVLSRGTAVLQRSLHKGTGSP